VQLPEGPYETVAGYVLAELGELPGVGAEVEVHGHKLTVTELDGRRIARVRVGRAGQPGAGGGAGQPGAGGGAGQAGAGGGAGEKTASPAPGERAASPPSAQRNP